MRRIVLEAANEAQVRPACDLLAAHGIAFRVNGAPLTSLRGVIPFADASVTVEVVRDEDVEPARRLLAASAETAAAQDDWRCPGCGEESPGTFDVCWKCGRSRAAAPAAAATSPYRGDRPAPAEPAPPAAQERTRATRWRDLGWALAGCAVVALAGIWFGSDSRIVAGWPFGRRTAVLNLVAGFQLLLALALYRRRGLRPSDALGAADRWAFDLLSAALLAALVFLSSRTAYHVVRGLVGPPPGSIADSGHPQMLSLDLGLLTAGLVLAASTGSVWLYGALLPAARDALGSRIAAFLITSLAGTLMWSPTLYLPRALSVLVGQLVLCGAFLAGGRAWPVAMAAAASYFLRWFLVLGGR
jgi:hypothetical protein